MDGVFILDFVALDKFFISVLSAQISAQLSILSRVRFERQTVQNVNLRRTDTMFRIKCSELSGIGFFLRSGHRAGGESVDSMHQEDGLGFAFALPRAIGASGSCLVDLKEANVHQIVVSGERGDSPIICDLPLAPEVVQFQGQPRHTAFVQPGTHLVCEMVGQMCAANNGFPIGKVVAHAINAPSVEELLAPGGWRGTLVFVDMNAYQEVDFVKHYDYLRMHASEHGVNLGDHLFELESFIPKNTGPLSQSHPFGLPFYVRGWLTVHLEATCVGANVAVRSDTLVTKESVQSRVQAGQDPIDPLIAVRFAEVVEAGEWLQRHFRRYIHHASEPYNTSPDDRSSLWGQWAPYVLPWKRYVVPQYMSVGGLEVPASAIIIGSAFSQKHDRLERFFVDAVSQLCVERKVTRAAVISTLERIQSVYLLRRRQRFREQSMDPARTLSSADIDLWTALVNIVFTETTSSMNYTTDTSVVSTWSDPSDPDSVENARVLHQLAENNVLEIERLTVDLFRLMGFDCEDGSTFHYRLHRLLVTNRFMYSDAAVQAFAGVMDLYMVMIAKMQCSGDPTNPKDASRMVCHILSWTVLRDHAYEMLYHGVAMSPVCVGRDGATRTEYYAHAVEAARDIAFLPADAYRYPGNHLGDGTHPLVPLIRSPSVPHSSGERHYPLPHVLALEPTAPVPCEQAPAAQLYPDVPLQTAQHACTLRDRHASKLHEWVQSTARTQRISAPPVLVAYPEGSEGTLVEHVQACNRGVPSGVFTPACSSFYYGVISVWMPDHQFIRTVQYRCRPDLVPRQQLPRDALPSRPCFLDWLCCIRRRTQPSRRTAPQYGVPHNLFVSQCSTFDETGGGSVAGVEVVFVPTLPVDENLAYALASVVANEKAPEAPIVPDGAQVCSAATTMPRVAALAEQYPLAIGRANGCVSRMIPSDAHMCDENTLASHLERALHQRLFTGLYAHSTIVSMRTGQKRVKPLLSEATVFALICLACPEWATCAQNTTLLTRSRLISIITAGAVGRLLAPSATGPDTQSARAMIPKGMTVAQVKRAVSLYVMDRMPIVRHCIMVA